MMEFHKIRAQNEATESLLINRDHLPLNKNRPL